MLSYFVGLANQVHADDCMGIKDESSIQLNKHMTTGCDMPHDGTGFQPMNIPFSIFVSISVVVMQDSKWMKILRSLTL